MKKFVFILIFVCCAVCAAAACSRSDDIPEVEARLYFVDSEINRLLPYPDALPDTDAEHMAKSAIKKLAAGRPDNKKIRQLLPSGKNDVTVRVQGDVAYVDLKSKAADTLPQSRDIERLFIYQIVDTLTSIKGIRFVRFTVDGEIHKSFMGFYDMRETYKYTYPE